MCIDTGTPRYSLGYDVTLIADGTAYPPMAA
jgi:hypothetical protein